MQPLNIESDLRKALRREHPSAGFADRVVARATARRKQKLVGRWMAVAAMLAAGTVVTTEVHDRRVRQREAEEKAGRQLVIALRITGHQLRATRQLIRRSTNGT